MVKLCKDCGLEKLLDDFYKHPTASFGRLNTCKMCTKIRRKQDYKNDPSKRLNYYYENSEYYANLRLRNRYGITTSDYKALFDAQLALCKICKKSAKVLFVDHCHETGVVRGLLCDKCNSALGYFKDNLSVLARCVTYLSSTHNWQFFDVGFKVLARSDSNYRLSHNLKYNYGISIKTHTAMRVTQNDSCELCRVPFEGIRRCVDHCHTTGRVRGLLCINCNFGLGHFSENVASIQEAIIYLTNDVYGVSTEYNRQGTEASSFEW